MLERLLIYLSAHLPCRFIDGDEGEPYLERYYLWGVLGWHAYLHHFVASDPDRGLHDHPWDRALSLVLVGGYEEIRLLDPGGCETRVRRVRPFGINRLRGQDFHRVILAPGGSAWTLFFHGPRSKGWGFLQDGSYRSMARDGGDFRHRDWWRDAPNGRAMRATRGAFAPPRAGS